MNKKFIISLVLVISILAIGGAIYIVYTQQALAPTETSEMSGDQKEVNGSVIEKDDLIRVTNISENQEISSPLTITGEARGPWYFEASFPVILTNWDGLIIAEGIAEAQDEWMVEDYVPFSATLEFEKPSYGDTGSLILQKDNPSGLPEHDNALEIPIRFQ